MARSVSVLLLRRASARQLVPSAAVSGRGAIVDPLPRVEQAHRVRGIGVIEDRVIDRESRVLVARRYEHFRDRSKRLRVARRDLQVLAVGRDRVVVVLARIVSGGEVEHRIPLVGSVLGVARRVDHHPEIAGGGVVPLGVEKEHGEEPEPRRLLPVDRIGLLQHLDAGIGIAGIEQSDRRVVNRDPGIAAPHRDVVLALGLQLLGARERRIGPNGILLFDVIPGQPVPGGGVLILTAGLDRLGQGAVGVAQILLPVLVEPATGGALEIQEPGVHQVMAHLEVAPGLHELPLGGRATGEQRRRQHYAHRPTDSHVRTPWFAPRGARRRAEPCAPPRAAAGRELRPPPERRRIRA